MLPRKPSVRVFSVLGVAVLLLGLGGCRTTGVDANFKFTRDLETGHEQISVGVTIHLKPEGLNNVVVADLFETREYDPSLLSPNHAHPGTATVTIRLSDGSEVSSAQQLVLDPTTQVPPTIPGYDVAVYRLSDPSAAQGFIDQYLSQATDIDIQVSTNLLDVSSGETPAARIDVSAADGSTLAYMGTWYANLPNYVPGPFIR